MHEDFAPAAATTPANPSAELILSVIVPTRNEARNIAPLLARLAEALAGEPHEIVFVDDSSDDTPQIIARAATGAGAAVRLIARPDERRNGLSGAVVEGMAAARGRWLCVMDADLQHPPETIPLLLAQARRTGADVVVASREADVLGPVGLSRARALTSQSLTILARMVFPRVLKNVSDPLTGFFLVRRDVLDPTILQPEGFKILLEILARHPDLRVTELHFTFAPRYEGQSKADLNEGMRFFRHLIRLRLTVNQHLSRFLTVLVLVLILNLVLLALLIEAAGWSLPNAAMLTGAATIAALLCGEVWIFSDRPRDATRRRLRTIALLSLVFLIVIYLPVVWLLAGRLGLPYPLAALVAMSLAGFVYYLFSEQWIWTRGLMMRPRHSEYYDIHGILTLASQIPLADLAYFRVDAPPRNPDLLVRVDRHGTPSRVSGAICYDEHLGRFGFGLTIIPGDFTEIVVSPLLETSPAFLYVNVIEPVLRWQLLARGFALAHAAAAALVAGDSAADPAVLITGGSDMSYGLSLLARRHGMAFMGDDVVIVGRDRLVRSYPKPVTVNHDMLRGRPRTARARLGLRLQRLLYSRPVRAAGLFLSRRRLPAATANTYLQRLIPQPKLQLAELLPEVTYADAAALALVVVLEKGEMLATPLDLDEAATVLDHHDVPGAGFQPYPLLVTELARWSGRDWAADERAILRAALSGAGLVRLRAGADEWWDHVARLIGDRGRIRPARTSTALAAESV